MNLFAQLKLLNKLSNVLIKITSVRTVSGGTLQYETDPQPMFTDAETQKLLKSITQLQINKVFRRTTVPNNKAELKFMTTEQLEGEFRDAVEKAKKKLQMTPVLMIKPDAQTVISMDKPLKHFSDTKFVFTDITYGIKQRQRKVVIREIDGTLHDAPMDIAKRMKQLYVPLNGRKIQTPKMFEEEHFQRCLDEHKYEFIMDRLVVQFDPDEPEYHRLSSIVYQHLNETKQFDQLRSTRHFGPMAFFYAWHKCIDDLLYDMIKRDYLRNASELIALQYKLHSMPESYGELLQKLEQFDSVEDYAYRQLRKNIQTKPNTDIHQEIETAIGKTADDFIIDDLCLEFIENFLRKYALKKVQLELAVQTLREINTEKKQLFEGLTKAHGVQSVKQS